MKTCLLSLCLTLIPFQNLSAGDFYVSPTGNDLHAGSNDRPFRTLSRARDAVREVNKAMTEDIVVHLAGGRYPIADTVEFGPLDSGYNGHKVVYRAFQDEKPVLTGGVKVTDWELHDKEKNIYRASAPKTVFRQVYIDDKAGIRARTPNRESETSFGPYWSLEVPKKPECHVTKEAWEACAGVDRLSEVELVIATHWYHQRIRIGEHGLTDDGAVVVPVKPSGKMSKKQSFYRVSYFFFENALAFVDAANEWYHDSAAGVLYLKPPAGTDPNTLRIEVPVAETLVAIAGTAEDPVRNIEFQGLTLQCSNWPSPSKHGLNVTQFVQPVGVKQAWDNADWPLALIRAKHARQIAFRNNVVRNAGAHGIQFFADVDDADIEGNEIYQIAGNGIEIDSHAANRPKPEQQSTGVAIWNNHIWRAGQNYTNGGALLAHNVRGLIVEHNLIHDMPYSGMQIGNQPGGMNDIGCGENRIRYNHVHHCMQLHDDGGGIYTLGGIQRGTVIAENYLHDIQRTKWAGSYKIDLIYLDNFTSETLVKDNVVNGGRAAERNRSAGNTLINNVQSDPAVEANAGIQPGYDPREK